MKSVGRVALFGCVIILGLVIERETRPCLPLTFVDLKNQSVSSDFVVEDSLGHVLSRLRRDFRVRRLDWLALSEFPLELRRTVVESEDHRFWSHKGVDFFSLGAAIWGNLRGHGRGASTLTMQLVKITGNVPNTKTILGKIRQMRAAWAIEKSWDKNEILEAYLNLAPFRGDHVGFQAAALQFFGKEIASLSSEEIFLLVVCLKNPNAPIQNVVSRACRLRPKQCLAMTDFARQIGTRAGRTEEDLASHLAVSLAPAKGGHLRTTLDGELQLSTKEILANRLRVLVSQNVRDGAALVVDRHSGQILASVGSAGPFSKSPLVDGTRALRQVGSTLKPFLYALAFQKGILTPESWIEDSQVDLVLPRGIYRPRNHDRTFHGWVRVRTALASSLNVPAVKVLQLVGEDLFWSTLKDSGLQSLRPMQDYGLALALGVADLSLFELTSAYLTLANHGTPLLMSYLPSPSKIEGTQVFHPEVVARVEEILSSKTDRALGFGFESGLDLPFPYAVKTGTSKDMRDNWAVGWTKDYVIGIWVGNFDGESMWDVSGLSGAAPAWSDIAMWLHQHRRDQTMPRSVPTKTTFDQKLVLSQSAAIEYPPSGLVMAMDPEIPLSKQVVPLLVRGTSRKQLFWRVDGGRPFAVQKGQVWRPTKGKHQIDLLEGTQVRQSADIVVR